MGERSVSELPILNIFSLEFIHNITTIENKKMNFNQNVTQLYSKFPENIYSTNSFEKEGKGITET